MQIVLFDFPRPAAFDPLYVNGSRVGTEVSCYFHDFLHPILCSLGMIVLQGDHGGCRGGRQGRRT